MRWSLIFYFFSASIVLSAFDGTLVLSAPVKAAEVKQSSATYRGKAAKNKDMYDLGVKPGIVKKVPITAKVSGAYHADHIFEAQSLVTALDKAKITKAKVGDAKWKEMKLALNSPENLVMVPGDVNMAKGRICRAGITGCTPKQEDVDLAQNYIKKTQDRAKDTATKLDTILGTGNVVQSQHAKMMSTSGLRRRASLLSKEYEG